MTVRQVCLSGLASEKVAFTTRNVNSYLMPRSDPHVDSLYVKAVLVVVLKKSTIGSGHLERFDAVCFVPERLVYDEYCGRGIAWCQTSPVCTHH